MTESPGPLFEDRQDAGRRLAERLGVASGGATVVLGLARGGVPVAFEVARLLRAPLDVLVVRKIGAPHQPELAVGALAPGATYLNERIRRWVGLSGAELDALVEAKRDELAARSTALRGERPEPELQGRTVILVDDGVATGATMFAAIESVRARGAAKVVVAVPVCAADTYEELRGQADEVVCLQRPVDFGAVSVWYRRFTQTTNEEVRGLLERARGYGAPPGDDGAQGAASGGPVDRPE